MLLFFYCYLCPSFRCTCVVFQQRWFSESSIDHRAKHDGSADRRAGTAEHRAGGSASSWFRSTWTATTATSRRIISAAEEAEGMGVSYFMMFHFMLFSIDRWSHVHYAEWDRLSWVTVSNVLWYCWLGLLTCKIGRPYNLYCVGADLKPCSTNQQFLMWMHVGVGGGEGRSRSWSGTGDERNARRQKRTGRSTGSAGGPGHQTEDVSETFEGARRKGDAILCLPCHQ